MREIQLTQGLVALVDDEDFETLSVYKWCAHRSYENGSFYAVRRDVNIAPGVPGKIIKMHQMLLGERPGYEIDHEDNNGLNNQRYNLRFLTHSRNLANIPKRSGEYSSIYKGVSYDKERNRWAAYIGGKPRIFIGRYSTEEQAAKMYDKVALYRFGDAVKLNFPVLLKEQQQLATT